MNHRHQPSVLIIDDDPDFQRPLAYALSKRTRAEVLHPQDVEPDDLRGADLVLVDLRLDAWNERDAMSALALRPVNGIALAGILRETLRVLPDKAPVAIAIHSAHLGDLTAGLQVEPREHALARALNVEWVFPKVEQNRGVALVEQITALALAIQVLPPNWPHDDRDATMKLVASLLSLPLDATWAERALDEIEDCHPPLDELAERSQGLAFVRWLLHRVLPYPCFLLDHHRLAARLRVDIADLQDALHASRKLRTALNRCRYTGILESFQGSMWWRSGIEKLVWDLTNGNTFDPNVIRQALGELAGKDFSTAKYVQPVIVIDQNFAPCPKFAELDDDVVRIQPDDWPPYADQAWTTVELARAYPSLRALVIRDDREKIATEHHGSMS